MQNNVFYCVYVHVSFLVTTQQCKKGKMEKKRKKTIIDFLNNLLGVLSILSNKTYVKFGNGLQKCENWVTFEWKFCKKLVFC